MSSIHHQATKTSLAQCNRDTLTQAKRIVVKVGTHVLVNKNGQPNRRRIQKIADGIQQLRQQGKQVILVTSGSIAAGIHSMGLSTRPTHLPDLQMAAAIGQTRLLTLYKDIFSQQGCTISQILLTHDDLKNRRRHLNVRNTLLNLLDNQVLPIVNENDVVSVDEIKVGDNDVLSALVSSLVDADLLILLTTVDGLRRPQNPHQTSRVAYLDNVKATTLNLVMGKSNALSTGGMATKLKAAQMAVKLGALVVIADGTKSDTIAKISQGDDIGTLIGNTLSKQYIESRKRWIGFFHRPQGQIIIDDGAKHALIQQGKSLLAIGITAVKQRFDKGAVVSVLDQQGQTIAHGLVDYTSTDIDKIKGLNSAKIAKLFDGYHYSAVIHRNNLLILEPS